MIYIRIAVSIVNIRSHSASNPQDPPIGKGWVRTMALISNSMLNMNLPMDPVTSEHVRLYVLHGFHDEPYVLEIIHQFVFTELSHKIPRLERDEYVRLRWYRITWSVWTFRWILLRVNMCASMSCMDFMTPAWSGESLSVSFRVVLVV